MNITRYSILFYFVFIACLCLRGTCGTPPGLHLCIHPCLCVCVCAYRILITRDLKIWFPHFHQLTAFCNWDRDEDFRFMDQKVKVQGRGGIKPARNSTLRIEICSFWCHCLSLGLEFLVLYQGFYNSWKSRKSVILLMLLENLIVS